MNSKILIVDDEEPVRAILDRLLTLHGYEVDAAADGAEAINRLREKRYDLMILDRYMPKISGIDVIGIVRSSPHFKKLKILMLTHADVTKYINEAFDAGIDGYILKPFDMSNLLEKVRKALLSMPAEGEF